MTAPAPLSRPGAAPEPAAAPAAFAAARPLRVAILQGSVREGRRSGPLVSWAAARLAADPRFEVEVIDPRELGLGLWHDTLPAATLAGLRARIAAADAFLAVFPELNRGYPAALKALIDLAKDEWRDKPAGFVTYGGRSGGARAAGQLAEVLVELHVPTIRDSVLLTDVGRRFDAGNAFQPDAEAEAALSLVLDRLAAWAGPLRDLRAARAVAGEAA